jgi:hypothetical protein
MLDSQRASENSRNPETPTEPLLAAVTRCRPRGRAWGLPFARRRDAVGPGSRARRRIVAAGLFAVVAIVLCTVVVVAARATPPLDEAGYVKRSGESSVRSNDGARPPAPTLTSWPVAGAPE